MLPPARNDGGLDRTPKVVQPLDFGIPQAPTVDAGPRTMFEPGVLTSTADNAPAWLSNPVPVPSWHRIQRKTLRNFENGVAWATRRVDKITPLVRRLLQMRATGGYGRATQPVIGLEDQQ
jgi:hypothetical protein